MKISKAEFVASSPNLKICPKSDYPEVAFIGRSNVGKSSLINFLTGRNALAKVSQTPGKTRMINHFNINDEWMLVDLPGYGYAKMSKVEKEKMEKMIFDYLSKRDNLIHTFLLIDSRHDLQNNDQLFIQWLQAHQIAFSIITTKTDKISKNQLLQQLKSFGLSLGKLGSSAHIIPSSSEKKNGKDEILEYIGGLLNTFTS